MADENKPAFYPRVGNIKAKNFKPAQPMPFVYDERAMELPDYKEFIPKLGTVDLSVPSKENRELNRRITERDADLMRQVQADRSPLEKLAGGIQASRFMGSALTQAVNSLPTRIFKGDEAADKFIQDRIYKPEQPLAYEYAQDIGDFLEKLETEYKIPPVLPEAVALQFLTGPATAQAARAAGRGAEQVGRKIESAMEPVVKGALERGGLPREMVMAMGANTQSNVMKPSNKANWLSGPSIHVPEGDAWRFKTSPIAGETPAQRIPRHEELLNDPTLNQDQIDRVKYQLEQTKGEAALDKWADNALMGYFKGQLASPEDPVRLMIERNYANIEAKFAKDQERATKMAQRAEAELDPRKQANMKRQADTMFVQARDDRDVAMQNISHLPSEMLQDITLDPKSYIKEERVKAGYPAEGLGTTTPSRKWEHQADEAIKVSRAGDIQNAMDLQPKLDKAIQENYAVSLKIGEAFGNLLREKGLDEDTIQTLVKSMPRDQRAEAVGMLDEMQKADSNYLRLLDQDRSFPKFAAQDNPFVSKLDPETKMYSGYMGDLGFEHVMDVLRQDLAAERLRPEQLNKLSVEQAVKRTQEYNLEMARKMNSDRASARANLPVYKDYPDGYKWVQLNQPGNFAAESQAMGHSVKGYEPRKGDPDWVEGSGNEGSPMYGHGGWDAIKSGRAKVYSLVDSRGAPHATIEIKTNVTASPNDFRLAGLDYSEAMAEAKRRMGLTPETEKELTKSWDGTKRAEASQELHNIIDGIYKERVGEMPQTITQIKGKGNNKPIADYIPYVQDFVRSGNWHSVDDFHHTDLISADQIRKAGWDMKGNNQKFFTKQEFEDLKNAEQKRVEGGGMKRGGKVSISNNPDTMMLELGNQKMKNGVPAYGAGKAVTKQGLKAAKPAISEAERALPLRLPRAMPKSNAEINAHAERVARQIMGEHVTSGKAGDTRNLAGRSLKESKRVKALEYEFVPTKDVPESQVYQPRIGDINVALGGDFTLSDVELKSLMGEPINSRQEGGSRYGLGHMDAKDPLFYASNEVPAQAVQNKVTDLYDLYGPRRIMGQHMAMGPVATNFAQHFADANLKYTDYSKLRPQDMYEFDKIISEGFVTSKKDKKTGETVYKIVDFPDWPGIADPEAAYGAMKENSEMRKWYNRVMQTPKITEPLGFPNAQDVRYAITSPDLRDMEVNLTGHGVGELVPNVDLTDTANHNTYRKGIRGLYEGHQEVLSPFAISFPDATQHIITHQRPQDFTGTIQKVFPHQRVDQQFIDEMEQYRRRIKELTGKKKGGAVEKAEGGYLKKPAAYINGDEFVNAAKKYGIKDSMNNLNKIVDLVNKGLSVDDAARQVADTGMHKAAGGAISGDDLILEERPL